MKSEDLHFLNGFLQAMAMINVGTNHGHAYLIEPMERLDALEKSLDSHFASFFEWLAKRYPHAAQKLQVTALPEWKLRSQKQLTSGSLNRIVPHVSMMTISRNT